MAFDQTIAAFEQEGIIPVCSKGNNPAKIYHLFPTIKVRSEAGITPPPPRRTGIVGDHSCQKRFGFPVARPSGRKKPN
jgi:hypothetical protein